MYSEAIQMAVIIIILYSQKILQGTKFGDLAVFLCKCQIKIGQYFFLLVYNYIYMVIPYQTAKF